MLRQSRRALSHLPLWLGLIALLFHGLPALSQSPPVSVLTQHNDNQRTGENLNETTLTTANVNAGTFGKLFSCPVDGFVYAQPLYVPGVTIGGGTHNVLYVATAHDSVYAFDADTGAQLQKMPLGTAVPSSVINTPNIQVEVGIISTPVIDAAAGTLYVVAKTYTNSVQQFWLHALDITTLQDKLPPVLITAQSGGTGYGAGHTADNDGQHVFFVASKENQRPALTLVNGVLYLAFASHEDYDDYHGWVLAYNAPTLTQIAAYNDTPNGKRGGIWMGGQGLVADAASNVYLISGNSANDSENSVGDFGECFLKLGLSGGSLSVLDYFKAKNYDSLNAGDSDLGSGGAIGIPGTTYLVGGGKQGLMYVVNTTNMGQLNTSADQVVQEWQADNGLWGCPVFWNGATPALYVWSENDHLKAYPFSNGLFTTTPASVSAASTPGGVGADALSVSSNGSTAGTGIVWATSPLANPDHNTEPGVLYAFDASNVANELWDSTQSPGDGIGNFAKYCAPTVANGKVYVGTDSEQVCVYGLVPAVPPVAPTGLTAAAGNALAVLNWAAAPRATDYNVKRATQSGGPYTTVATGVTTTNYIDRGLTNGTTYYYVVSSHNFFGESAGNSNEAIATPSAGRQGSILSLNFVGNDATPMAVTESAGLVPAVNWNNGAGSQGGLVSLLDNLGLTTGTSATWTANDPWAIGLPDTPGNDRMMNGYLDSTNTSTTSVTVSGLTPMFTGSGYDVYVYCNGDVTGRAGDYTIGGTKITASDSARFNGAFAQANNSAGNYVEFPGLTGGSFTVTAHASATGGGFRAPVNAIQIVAHVPPTVASAAAATPNPVTGTTAGLSVLGADGAGEATLTYTWSAAGPAAVTFSPNGTNAAKNATAAFTQAGAYTLTVTIADAHGLTATSNAAVTVGQTLTTIAVLPSTATVTAGQTQPFTATASDQFGHALSPQPAAFTWAATGAGTISSTGLFTGVSAGPAAVTASSAGVTSPAASVTVTAAATATALASSLNPSALGQSVTFTATVTGASPTGTVTFALDGAAQPAVALTAGQAALTTSALAAGSHSVTAAYSGDGSNSASTSSVLTQTVAAPVITVTPATATIMAGGAQQFAAVATGQGGAPLSPQPAFAWAVTGGGTITGAGLFTAGGATGGPFTVTATAAGTSGTAGITITAQTLWLMNDPHIGHVIGRADTGGWSVNTTQYPVGFMQYGPYTTRVAAGAHTVTWQLMVDNNTFTGDNGPVLELQVLDNITNALLAVRDVQRHEWAGAFKYQGFSVPFTLPASHAGDRLEFRVLWFRKSYVREQSVSVQ